MAVMLITGGCGFIGSNMAEYFFKHGWQVIALDNFIREGVIKNANIIKKLGCKVVEGDIRNVDDLKMLPKVDAIINLAANPGIPWSIKDPIYDASTNIMGALNVFEFARVNDACVIQASTNKVYSDEINIIPLKQAGTRYQYPKLYAKGISERFPVDGVGRPHSPYGVSKLAADIYAQEYNTTFDVPTICCRMSAIYGPRQMGASEQGWIVWFMNCKKYKLPLTVYGDGMQVRDVLYIDDLCRLYSMLINQMKYYRGSVFNVGGGINNTLSVYEMIEWLNKKDGERLNVSYEDWRVADHKVYISDITKVSQTVGWMPKVGVEEGLTKTWEWVVKEF